MKTYAALDYAARDRPPFSNSTEGEAWMGKWCDRCSRDRAEDGCPLVLIALCGKTPREWEDTNSRRLGGRYRCTEFRKAKNVKPPTEVPGQLALFTVEDQ